MPLNRLAHETDKIPAHVKQKGLQAAGYSAAYAVIGLLTTAAGPIAGSAYGFLNAVSWNFGLKILAVCDDTNLKQHLKMEPKNIPRTMIAYSQRVECGQQPLCGYRYPIVIL